jgi:hypothetical protein
MFRTRLYVPGLATGKILPVCQLPNPGKLDYVHDIVRRISDRFPAGFWHCDDSRLPRAHRAGIFQYFAATKWKEPLAAAEPTQAIGTGVSLHDGKIRRGKIACEGFSHGAGESA